VKGPDYTMRWFGERPWALLCRDCPRVPTPVGAACLHCGEPIVAGDDGVVQLCIMHGRRPEWRPAHDECNLRAAIGGLAHIEGRCMCCGGTDPPDPPGMTRREAARAAVRAYRQREAAAVFAAALEREERA